MAKQHTFRECGLVVIVDEHEPEQRRSLCNLHSDANINAARALRGYEAYDHFDPKQPSMNLLAASMCSELYYMVAEAPTDAIALECLRLARRAHQYVARGVTNATP